MSPFLRWVGLVQVLDWVRIRGWEWRSVFFRVLWLLWKAGRREISGILHRGCAGKQRGGKRIDLNGRCVLRHGWRRGSRGDDAVDLGPAEMDEGPSLKKEERECSRCYFCIR